VSTTPPLTWLRAFEASARLGSLKNAADELAVAPSTISHHVRDLEVRLGVPLFARTGRGVTLTDEGEQYFEVLRHAFDLLRAGAPNGDAALRLRIGCFPFLANEVLVPRFGELKRALAGVEITLRNETRLDALVAPTTSERLDVVIRYGDGRFPGCLAMKLADVDLVPIIAPSYACWDRSTAGRRGAPGTA
jgi:LysR family glycine cleavage system transcriptional activator